MSHPTSVQHHVQSLRDAIAAGTYSVDPERVAEALLRSSRRGPLLDGFLSRRGAPSPGAPGRPPGGR